MVLLCDVVGEFGLEGMKSTNPALLVTILVSHHRGINDFRQNEHADADEDEEQRDRPELEVGEEGLEALQALVATGVLA